MILIYLNQFFFVGDFVCSCLISDIFTAFLKAKFASTAVIIDIRNKPDRPINCSI